MSSEKSMLADVPMVFILIGITAYTVLSGADFGAGLWTLVPGGGQAGAAATRDHTRHAIGPVWEANHVWLIFVLATVIGGIATGRVPVGNARGDLITSWLNPVSVLAGVLAVAFSGYLAAVYLAADARR